MRKRMSAVIVGALAVVTLVGCEPTTLMYNDKEYDTDTLGEVLEDTIEAQNPELDLEVEIYVETEDE